MSKKSILLYALFPASSLGLAMLGVYFFFSPIYWIISYVGVAAMLYLVDFFSTIESPEDRYRLPTKTPTPWIWFTLIWLLSPLSLIITFALFSYLTLTLSNRDN